MLVGCAQSSAIECADGRVCPSGTTCDDNHGLCLTESQTEACNGIADGSSCNYGTQVGVCDLGVCVPTGCGNNVTDLGEVCDDGNTTSGDGCRADCQKREACGDGALDEGEACDDGNTSAVDGCDACKLTAWRTTVLVGGTATATTIGLAQPTGVAFDRSGNVYAIDATNQRVRRVDANGIVTTIAGNGTAGFSGDGGPATSAQLNFPIALAVDGLGNVYIADSSNHRVRRVDGLGIITTIAGTGNTGSSGDGGPATGALLNLPVGVAVDGLGNVFISEQNGSRIRRVDAQGIITTIAGTGTNGDAGPSVVAATAPLNTPRGIALDTQGNLLVAESFGNRVRRIDFATALMTTIAGDGTFALGGAGDGAAATSAQLATPIAVAVDGTGNIYIAEQYNRIRRVDTGNTITTFAGTGTAGATGDGGAATAATFDQPIGIASDAAGTIAIADRFNNRVRVIRSGTITTLAGSGTPGLDDGTAATTARLSSPAGIAVDAQSNVYIADRTNGRIVRVDAAGSITWLAGAGGYGFSGDGGPARSARFRSPESIAVDAAGNIYVTDLDNHRVRRIDTAGMITTFAGGASAGYDEDNVAAAGALLSSPQGVAVDSQGRVYIADTANHRIRRVEGGIITTFAGTGNAGFNNDNVAATAAQLYNPTGVAIDSADNVYIADQGNQRIRKVTNGQITTIAGTGVEGLVGDGGTATSAQLRNPSHVAVDANGVVYVSDATDPENRVRRISGGTISTFAGSTTNGFRGDGGPAATSARLLRPWGLAARGGYVYIADSQNHLVRRVDANGTITTFAGVTDPVGIGPTAIGRLADPTAFVVTAAFRLFAGGSSGTVQAIRTTVERIEVVAGRYPHDTATASFARFRDRLFGDVGGIAFDATGGRIFITEGNRVHAVTLVDPADENTWTIAPLVNNAGTGGFLDGAASSAMLRRPTGLYLDAATQRLYIADTGNHIVRVLDLANSTVSTLAGIPATRGFFGDGSAATSALLFEPRAVTLAPNGDLFVADTGNHRVRRITAGTNIISTVLGDGTPASSGEGSPSSSLPLNRPLGVACDPAGNLYVSSTTTIRVVAADAGVVDGTGVASTIYGEPPRSSFPASVTRCLSGVAVIDATTVEIVDSCTGLLISLTRETQ